VSESIAGDQLDNILLDELLKNNFLHLKNPEFVKLMIIIFDIASQGYLDKNDEEDKILLTSYLEASDILLFKLKKLKYLDNNKFSNLSRQVLSLYLPPEKFNQYNTEALLSQLKNRALLLFNNALQWNPNNEGPCPLLELNTALRDTLLGKILNTCFQLAENFIIEKNYKELAKWLNQLPESIIPILNFCLNLNNYDYDKLYDALKVYDKQEQLIHCLISVRITNKEIGKLVEFINTQPEEESKNLFHNINKNMNKLVTIGKDDPNTITPLFSVSENQTNIQSIGEFWTSILIQIKDQKKTNTLPKSETKKLQKLWDHLKKLMVNHCKEANCIKTIYSAALQMRQSDNDNSSLMNRYANFFTRHDTNSTSSWRKVSSLPEEVTTNNNNNNN